MKLTRLFILLLIFTMALEADPRHRHHSRPFRKHHHAWQSHGYNNYFTGFGYYRPYRPVVVTTLSTTTYPTNLITITAEAVAEDVVALNRLMDRGIITEKDFERAKKTLLNRIGMSMNPAAQGMSMGDIIDQIEILHQMKQAELISAREFKQQKKKILAMI